MSLLREILNGEKASYNVLKWQIFEFFKKANFCPKKFQQDRRLVAHLQIRNFLSNTFVALLTDISSFLQKFNIISLLRKFLLKYARGVSGSNFFNASIIQLNPFSTITITMQE